MALADLDLFEEVGLDQRVLDDEGAFRATLEKLLDLPVVGDVRGDGYSYGSQPVEDRATKETVDGGVATAAARPPVVRLARSRR